MPISMKLVIYRLARELGLFRLARTVTKRRLRILAYHGFALGDEADFRPKLFIRPKTFERRLSILNENGYRIVSLGQAIDELGRRVVHDDTVAITIDDGYASTLHVAAPLLQKYQMPATVYLTSYHMQTQTPVFDLVIAYIFWKGRRESAELLWPPGGMPMKLELSSPTAKAQAAERIITLGHRLASEADRIKLAQCVATALGIDFGEIDAKQAFRLMTPDEARQIQTLGIDVGLHTHRHRFPPDNLDDCRKELSDNLAYLTREVGVTPVHFCYPSGVYSDAQYPVLRECGVTSATTCDTGLVREGDSPYALRRFLDGEMVSEIEFEAELSGFAELLRYWLRIDRRGSGARATH